MDIDYVSNNINIQNFINYNYIRENGNLFPLEKKFFFVNKLLHLIEIKGSPLQNKICSEIERMMQIDSRTKQLFLVRVFEVRMNYHIKLKINQIFNSLVKYLNHMEI